MKCVKCGNEIASGLKFCQDCGTPAQPPDALSGTVPAAPTTVPAAVNGGKRRRSAALRVILPVAAALLLIAGALAAGYFLVYAKAYETYVDYDDYRGGSIEAIDIFSGAAVDAQGGRIQLSLDIVELNAYIDETDICDGIDMDGYTVRDLCFDTKGQYLYLNLKSGGGRRVDVMASYTVTLDGGALVVQAAPLKAGQAGALASRLFLRGVRIPDIEIPVAPEEPAEESKAISSAIDPRSESIRLRRGILLFDYDIKSGADGPAVTPEPDSGIAAWTVMVYMNGSDLEYDPDRDALNGRASDDLAEMIEGLTSDRVNLIVETGGTMAWARSDINPDINQRFQVRGGELVHLADLERRNMCDPATLVDFASWTIANYPAENYALLLWDHGGGVMYGYGYDLYYPDDSLMLPEIESALSQITGAAGVKLELFGFDACLMATLETAALVRPYAAYYIASEESEPGHGWDYRSVMELISDETVVSGDVFGRRIVSSFIAQAVDQNTSDKITLSVIDLSMIDELTASVDSLVGAISDDIAGDISVYNQIGGSIPKLLQYSDIDHYDLESFAKEMIQYYPILANDVMYALDDAVISKTAGYLTADSGGLSFYLPFYFPENYHSLRGIYAQAVFSPEYLKFADMMVTKKADALAQQITPVYTVNFDVDPFQISIDPDYDDNYVSNLYIQVWEILESAEQLLYFDLGYDAWVEQTETEHVYQESFYWWPNLFDMPLSIEVSYFDDAAILYSSPITLNGYDANLLFSYSYQDDAYTVLGYNYVVADGENSDFTTYSFVPGDQMELLYYTYDVNTQEEYYTTVGPYAVPQEGLSVIDGPLSGSRYALGFVIEDYNGELFFSEYAEFDYTLE